jgi:hypothetical protein
MIGTPGVNNLPTLIRTDTYNNWFNRWRLLNNPK